MLPGPNWVPAIVDTVKLVNVTRDYTLKQNAEMLTKDKNIVDVELSIVFRVVNPERYLFNAVNPLDSVNQATASALRQVVGNTTLDGILTQERAEARNEIDKQIRETVDAYNIGIEIIDVNLEPAKPPEQVSAAFDDAIKALEDEKRYINEAKAYREKVVPLAKGAARRIIEESQAYELSTVLDARAQVANFLAIYKDYEKYPEIIGDNIYYTKLSKIYSNLDKVLIDLPKNQTPFLFLPLDKMMESKSNIEPVDINKNEHLSTSLFSRQSLNER